MPACTPQRADTQDFAALNRDERRARASRNDNAKLTGLLASPFSFDIADFATWPPLLRETDIVRDKRRNYPGLLPISRSAWRSLIVDGYVSPGLLLGSKTRAWTREEIIEITKHGVQCRPRGRRALAREAQRQAAASPAT
jgi:hypothetical protein